MPDAPGVGGIPIPDVETPEPEEIEAAVVGGNLTVFSGWVAIIPDPANTAVATDAGFGVVYAVQSDLDEFGEGANVIYLKANALDYELEGIGAIKLLPNVDVIGHIGII